MLLMYASIIERSKAACLVIHSSLYADVPTTRRTH
jgi:hypothetical protein